MRLSLEDIFLSLTTEDQESGALAAPERSDADVPPSDQEAAHA
jgi:hypothetical protein